LADDFNQSVTYPFTNVYILQCNMHTFYQFMFSMVTKPVNLMIENIEPYGKKQAHCFFWHQHAFIILTIPEL